MGLGLRYRGHASTFRGALPQTHLQHRGNRGLAWGTDWRQRAGGLVFFSQLAMWALLNSEWVLFYQVNA